MEQTKSIKITVELDSNSEADKSVIEFIENEVGKMKSLKVEAPPLKKTDLLRLLISAPNKTHEKKVKELFLSGFSVEDKLHALYTGYTKSSGMNITVADFSLNHLNSIKTKQRKELINNFLVQ